MPTIAIRIFDPHTVIIVAVQVVPQPLLFDAMQFDAAQLALHRKSHARTLKHTFITLSTHSNMCAACLTLWALMQMWLWIGNTE